MSRFDPMQTDERTQTPALLALAKEVAAALGEQWAVIQNNDSNYPQARIVCDGRGLCFDLSRRNRRQPRIEISGYYGYGNDSLWHFKPHNMESPKITVDAERDVKAIVNEINRRVLPDYWKVIAACLEAKQAKLTRGEIVNARWRELNRIGDGIISKGNWQNDDEEFTFHLSASPDISLDGRVSAYDSISFSYKSMSYDLFLYLLPHIVEYIARKRAARAVEKAG
jgi:hypothetical protein